MRSPLLAVFSAALLVSTAACDSGSARPGDKGADSVAPKQVSAEELKAAVSDPRVRAFYEARQWQAAWNEDQARALTQKLRQAPRHGLEAASFLKESDVTDDPVAREATLSLAAISYADALANGQVDPRKIMEVYTIPGPKVDVTTGLNQAVEDGNVGDWLDGLAPQDEEYRALSEAFLRYSQGARRETPDIAEGDAIEAGSSDPRVPHIAAALRTGGYLPAETEGQQAGQQAGTNRYTPQMAEAVKRLQQDYGMKADGVVGNATLEALNKGPAERARTLAINLERRRWLERQSPETRIDVNTAAAFLRYYRDGAVVDQRRTVVGQHDWETPPLGSPIVRLVANPPWNVPKSIEEDELSSRSEAYLARNGFTRQNGRLVQAAGPDSALGLVKFDMENKHAIYLHDTPAKALFATDRRHSSHGCVRVHEAIEFARMLASHQGKRAEFDRALASGEETFVDLPQEIPVRLLYHTAYVEDGRVMFRADEYGWDDKLAQALGLPVSPRANQPSRVHVSVAGP